MRRHELHEAVSTLFEGIGSWQLMEDLFVILEDFGEGLAKDFKKIIKKVMSRSGGPKPVKLSTLIQPRDRKFVINFSVRLDGEITEQAEKAVTKEFRTGEVTFSRDGRGIEVAFIAKVGTIISKEIIF